MAPRGETVYRFQQKVEILAQILAEVGKIGSPTIPELARFAAIPEKTLYSSVRSGRASPGLQRSLCQVARFGPNNPAWIDREIPEITRLNADRDSKYSEFHGRDTPEHFYEMLRVVWGLSDNPLLALRDQHPETSTPELIRFTFSESGQETRFGSPLPLFLELTVTPGFDASGYEFGYNTVAIDLVFPPTAGIRAEKRLGHEAQVLIQNARLEERGTAHQPNWVLSIKDGEGLLEGRYVTKEAALVEVSTPSLPVKFKGQLKVRPVDGSLRGRPEKPLPSRNKQIIIKRLIASALEEEVSIHGWITLGVQTLFIEESKI